MIQPGRSERFVESTGYRDARYARSLSDYGHPMQLPESGAWYLKRTIPGSRSADGMGLYPLCCCHNWSGFQADLDRAASDLVCFSAVLDPFGPYTRRDLARWFPDVVLPFKQHYVVDLRRSWPDAVSAHHHRYARKALRLVEVERCRRPTEHLQDWIRLYDVLIRRHSIRGLRQFSEHSFADQLAVPGMHAFRAVYESQTVGMLLWFVQDDIAFYHLGAFAPLGYQLHSSFGLFWRAFEYFEQAGLRLLDLGAGAGIRKDRDDPLALFKSGWTQQTRTAYFCGRIFQLRRYEALVSKTTAPAGAYFPAYRSGEFE